MIASTANFPTPSHMKIVSTMAVPPKSEPTESARSVTMVSSDERSTLFVRMTPSATPRAFAPVT